MSEVRRHQRRTASGKTVTVKRHERGTGAAAERKREAWEDRAAARWTPPPRPETAEAPATEEGWWDGDQPRPEAWMDDSELPPAGTPWDGEHDEPKLEDTAHLHPDWAKLNNGGKPEKQGRWELFKARAQASREMDDAQHRFSYAKTVEERDAAGRDFDAARDRLDNLPAPFGGH